MRSSSSAARRESANAVDILTVNLQGGGRLVGLVSLEGVDSRFLLRLSPVVGVVR